MKCANVLLFVDSVIGVGHFQRMSVLTEALTAHGMNVTVASGSCPHPTRYFSACHFRELPQHIYVSPADGRRYIIDHAGRVVHLESHDEVAWHRSRLSAMQAAMTYACPDIVIFEFWPFGHPVFNEHLLPLVEAIYRLPKRPLVVSSIRDVLFPVETESIREAMRRAAVTVKTFIDLVLVHGDEQFISLRETFPPYESIEHKVVHTGYLVGMASEAGLENDRSNGEVLVSAGAGFRAPAILQAIIRSRSRTMLRDRTWRIFTGPRIPDPVREALLATAREVGRAATTEEAASDVDFLFDGDCSNLGERLKGAALSISLGGYNTVVETLAARCPAVIVPAVVASASGLEDAEQLFRAERLEAASVLSVARPEIQQDTAAMARVIDQEWTRQARAEAGVSMSGGRVSVEALLAAWQRVCMPPNCKDEGAQRHSGPSEIHDCFRADG